MKKILKTIAFYAALLLIGFVIIQFVMVISPSSNMFANN